MRSRLKATAWSIGFRIGLTIGLSVFILHSRLSAQQPDPLCGFRSLQAICKSFGVQISLNEFRTLSGWSNQQGISMLDLYRAARAKGLYAQGLQLTPPDLQTLGVPAIVLVRSNHWLVVERFTTHGGRIIDAPTPPYTMPVEQFEQIWSGYALAVARDSSDLFSASAQANVLESADGPRIAFEATFYDFDQVLRGQVVEHVFHFHNLGGKPLRVDNLESSCYCTTALSSGQLIPPGGAGEIRVIFDSGVLPRSGPVTETVLVTTNDPLEPRIQLTLTGIVALPPVTVVPKRIHYGRVESGQTRIKTLELIDRDFGARATSAQKNLPYLSACIDSTGRRIELTLASDAPIGSFADTLVIHTDTPDRFQIKVPITGEVLGPVRLSPSIFFFGVLKSGTTATSTVRITSADNHLLKLSPLHHALPDYLTVELGPGSDGGYDLTVTLQALREGALQDTLEVSTDHPHQPFLKIPVYAHVTGTP